MSKYLIRNVNIIDGNLKSDVLLNYDVLVNGETIEKIGRDIEFDGTVYDYDGAYLMPGLINMHVHLPGSGKVGGKKTTDLKGLVKFIKSNRLTKEIGVMIEYSGAKTQLLSGVTTIRSVGGIGDFDSILSNRIKEGKMKGPRILSSNEAICTPGGHMEGTVSVAAVSVEDAVNKVVEIKNSGADLIKLMITGGVLDCKVKGHPGDLKMPLEMAKACCDKAHELGLKVAAHVEGPEGIEVAVKAGVDTIEHGALASDEIIDEFKKRNGALICTLSPAIPLSIIDGNKTGYGDDCTYNSNVLLEGMISMIEKCLEKGIDVGLGTDTGCPYVTHYDMWRELNYYAKYIKGVDNGFAIYSATKLNAKILGIDNITGSIEEGKCADMLLVKGNPLEDITVLKDPLTVIARGNIYKEKNKKFDNVEEELNRLL